MTVLVPGDVMEMKQVIDSAFTVNGPVYIRLGSGDVEDIYSTNEQFEIGKATVLREGNDATIITTGTMKRCGIYAADELMKNYGINARVLQMASIKPIDQQAVLNAAHETGKIVTVEEHTELGGLGGAVAEVVAEVGKAKVIRIGINDRFCGVGSSECLMIQEGLSVENIIRQIITMKD